MVATTIAIDNIFSDVLGIAIIVVIGVAIYLRVKHISFKEFYESIKGAFS
jgi:uncharacterized membrane protein YbhN (UPF0104 family)